MNKKKKIGIEFGISWFIPFVILIIVSMFYMPVELNTNLTITFALFSLVIAIFILLYKHKVAHAGHVSLIIGFLVLLYSIVMIYGAYSFGDKIQWWTLSNEEIGLYTFTGIVGLFAFIAGIRLVWSNRYFVGRSGRG